MMHISYGRALQITVCVYAGVVIPAQALLESTS